MIVWIPVTESLPEVGVRVLVKTSGKVSIPVTKTDNSIVLAARDHEGHWHSNVHGNIQSVTHWAYLDQGSV